MENTIDGSKVPVADKESASAPKKRSTARPKGEKQPDMTHASGANGSTGVREEDNQEALANTRDDAGRISSGTGTGPKGAAGTLEPSTVSEIVRSTMLVPAEPWRLAEDRDAHAKGACGRRDTCPACALQYVLVRTQSHCAAIANLIARKLEREDGAAHEEALLRGGAKIAAQEWPSYSLNTYALARSAYPEVLAGTVSAIDKMVKDKWRKERFAIFARNERSSARWVSATAPIPLRRADFKLEEQAERNLFLLRFSLTSGRTARGKEFALPLRAKDQRMYRDLRAIARGEAQMGAAQLLRNRQGKWGLRFAYKRLVQRVEGDKLAAINRGITCILAVVTEDSQQLIYDGYDIEAHLAATQAQRQRYQRGYKVSGRKGHGRKRALRPTDVLQEKTARWRKTRMQTIAREAARWLRDRGVSRVLVDDLEGIRDGAVELLDGGKPVWDRIQRWPYYEMGSRLVACLEEYGIGAEKRPVPFASRDCPQCGEAHEERTVGRKFVCRGCGYSRHVDVVLGLNLIGRERLSEAAVAAQKKRGKVSSNLGRKRDSRKREGTERKE
jgi:hypothetical protein